jgi:aerobic-type carbon monoxide dehydrogenase small subunit (CoxS/CutS family)
MPTVTLNVNGVATALDLEPAEKLLWVIRERLGLTGAKYGCGEGQCGACTVLVDGVPVRSCTARATLLAGRRIETIESLERDGRLHPVQQAFLDHEALQCGYCTPGMVMAAVGLLRANPPPADADIVKAMDHNLCRCGTYQRIVAAVRQAASRPEASR